MPIRFHQPYVSPRTEPYLREVLTGGGPFVERAQRYLEEQWGLGTTLLTHSCTGALELAALLLAAKPGDEVIVPSYTFPSTASAFLRAGFRVVFADIEAETLCLDVEDVRARITSRTRAIVAAHIAGRGGRVLELRELADQEGLTLIEDAAQAIDSWVDGRALGSIGDLATFSFHETKNLQCGLGGALSINATFSATRARHLWERGTNRDDFFRGLVDKYTWVEVGGSFAPSALQAAMLLAQLEDHAAVRERREALAGRYTERLAELAGAEFFTVVGAPPRGPAARWNAHALPLVFAREDLADTVRQTLAERGVPLHIWYVPLHTAPAGRALENAPFSLPVTEAVAPRVLRVPLHTEMSTDDVDHVADALGAVLG